ncbi:unnamed protein product [Paramecium pentaurelia]|uniref:Uncharacterized protein n=1 Tax=Paramecium pentaurelia TaxID=43138 RepID=A0A8S1UKN8_9CILI|nr:unnamed protein product [Paramecium pentaurelia]
MSDQESDDDQSNRQLGRLRDKQKRKYNQMEEEYYVQEQNVIANERRSARAIKKNYAATMSDEEEPINQPVEETEVKRIFVPEIDQILWRKIDQNTAQIQFLVKYKNRSYLHTEWLNEDRILDEKNGKQKINRFNKVFQKRIQEEIDDFIDDQYFDPAFQEVDRVLSCTEIFPIVHPKKGSEMKGKWAESLTKVMSHLLNFTRDQIHYGIYFLESKTILDFGTINNRLYLGYYKNYNDFWYELGSVYNTAAEEWQDGTEMNRITNTLTECAIVLYNYWYNEAKQNYQSKLQQQRYINEKAFKEKINDDHRKDIMPELKKEKINELVSKVLNIIDDKQYNIQEHFKEIEIILDQELNIKLQISNDQEFDLEDYLKQSLKDQDIDVAKEMQLEMQDFQSQMDTVDPDIESWNPGEKSFDWLNDSPQEIKILTKQEIENLSQEPDKLYFVKWKHLSYLEATWEPESLIDCRQKIQEFKQFNRSLDKETRNLMMQQNQNHKILVEYEQGIRKKKLSNMQIQDIKSQLYFLNQQKPPHEYTQLTQTIYKDKRLLRDYQLDSLNWLIRAWYEDRNVILADEMGLGKTIQTIAFLNHLYNFENYRGPFLIIAPLSTLQHWKRTVEEWTNLNAVLYYDQESNAGRSLCRQYEFFYTDISMKGILLTASEIFKFQILITSYEVFMQDFQNIFINVPFQYIVVDEAHKLKNSNARILQSLKRLSCQRTLLLTGTPIQNNTEELFSLLNFIEPNQFCNLTYFKRDYGQLETSDQVDRLNVLLKPYILRRQKEDVEQMIPPLQETIIDIEMTTIQKHIYKALYDRNKSMLEQGFSQWAANAASLNNLEIQLRKCCNHPFLIQEMQNEISKGCQTRIDYINKLVESSGKMILLDKLLNKFRGEGKKMLIFSQFTMMLQLLEEYLKFKQVKYEKIDGQIKARERSNAIDRFNDPSKKREVFLLSTKAGGQGINLTAAEIVVIYDSDWNPQNDVQATARAHRIGQSKEVTVYRLITKDTYESEMFERAIKKLGLDQAIFMNGQFKSCENSYKSNKNEKKMSKQDMEVLLKNGIIGLISNNQNGDTFQEKNIDEILEKNSRTAKYSLINSTYTVSKQSFVSEKTDKSINIQDPNFWKIILKSSESRCQKLSKMFDLHMSLQEQKKYLEEVGDCVNQLIESKLSQSNYSTDDEQILTDLLNKINSSNYAKNYRELAMNWIYELSKPSRRIKKITDLDLGRKQQRTVEIQGEDARRLASKSKEELIKKLCYVCERSNCSVFCMGHCRRAFHEACKQLLETTDYINIEGPDQDFLNNNVFPELNWSDEQLKEKINIRYSCPDCRNNLVVCLLCKQKGTYPPEKKSKEDIIVQMDEFDPSDDNIKKNKNKSLISKCSTANCNRYFHLTCIQANPLSKSLDTNADLFRCPSHICVFCKINSSNMTTALIHCVRCCRSFHSKCAPPEIKIKTQKIGKKVMICDLCVKPKEEKNQPSMIVKIPILGYQKKLKNSKTEFNTIGTTARTRKIQEKKYETQDSDKRKIDSSRSMSQEKISKKVQREKRNKDIHPYSYEELGIIPVKYFDYSKYTNDWCRYCGARFASNFTKGPWGSRTLCTIHYINWGQKKQLDLSEYIELPKNPINRDDQTELQFLQRQKAKDPNFDPRKELNIQNDEQYQIFSNY